MLRLTPVPVLLRGTGIAALALLLWNPPTSRTASGGSQPLILLDASLSMAGGAHPSAPAADGWRAALDSARAAQGVIWRFGDRVTAFDTTPPSDGASRLAPALEAAAAREAGGGAVTVVTDGAVDDLADVPADLLARAHVVVLARAQPFDAFVARVAGPRRLTLGDTLTLEVTIGTAGKRKAAGGKGARLVASVSGRRLGGREVTLPDSGTVATTLSIPVARFPGPGWSALEVRLEGGGDSEPRDDARLFVVEVSPEPAAVVLASPPDWESRFLGRVLGEVARVPVQVYTQTEPGRWRDGATMAPVPGAQVARAASGARLLALLGDPNRFAGFHGARGGGGVLTWSARDGREGDWYVGPPPVSPLAGELAGIAWDSLPPLAAVADTAAAGSETAGATVILAAQLARRGTPRPVALIGEARGGGGRRAAVVASGLWRWAFRGGASEQAYRGVVAALADYLLGGQGAANAGRLEPLTLEVANGLPLMWRWTGNGRPDQMILALDDGPQGKGARTDTLRFDAAGRAELRLPPAVYRYAVRGGSPSERGLVAVEEYSDEWRPSAPALQPHPGRATAPRETIGMRDRWWLFVVAMAAFAGEWAWRRRQGLP